VLRRVLEAPAEKVAFEVFNAGGDVNNFTKQMIVEAIREKLPDAPVRYQAQGGDPRNYKVNFTKIRTVLGFEPRWTVRDGIAELLGALEQGLFDDIESPRSFYGNYEVFLG
jgi:nucleoside-diphosphate-sugar epimerase